MTRKELVSRLRDVAGCIEAGKGSLGCADLAMLAAIFPDGVVGEEEDGHLVMYTGWQETKTRKLEEI